MRHRRLLIDMVVVTALAAATFAPALWVPFLNWDDHQYITQSYRTQTPGLAGLFQIWSMKDIWQGRFLEFFPLRDTVYWAVFQTFGLNAVAFHAVNIVAHAAACAMVLLLGRAFLSPAVAFWGAVLFSTHPLHVESIAWVAGLKDPLFFISSCAAVLLYERYRHSLAPGTYAASLVCLLAGLLSKGLALGVIPVLFALEFLTPPKGGLKERALRLVGPSLMATLFALQFIMVGKIANVIVPPHGGSWPAHFLLAGWSWVRYVQQAFVPTRFLLHYCFDVLRPPFDLRFLIMVPTLACLGMGFVMAARRKSLLAVAMVWFFSFLVPVSNLVPHPAVMADRYLYAPSAAACWVLAAALGAALSGRKLTLVAGAVAAVFAATSVGREIMWQDEQTLFAEVVEQRECDTDGEWPSAYILAKHAATLKDPAEALPLYLRAFGNSGFSALEPHAQCPKLIGAALAALKLADFARADDFALTATARCPANPRTWATLARVRQGRDSQGAIDAAERAYRLSPTTEFLERLTRARETARGSTAQ